MDSRMMQSRSLEECLVECKKKKKKNKKKVGSLTDVKSLT